MPEFRRITDRDRESLKAIPETGMGFQIVTSRTVLGERLSWLVLQSDRAVLLDRRSDADRWLQTRAAEGRLSQWWYSGSWEGLDLRSPELALQRAVHARGPDLEGLPDGALPPRTSLVKEAVTTTGQRFFRFSISSDDWRVDSHSGDFVPGTYATTATDRPLAPSGFAAVGRYALPNVRPASFVHLIAPPAGTKILVGTVAPAYGQAGGGVEVLFPEGAKHTLARRDPEQLPDE